uniref:hypothetical protein n=1 Tax=Agathobacter rectalis TaxID=39491 RepID=UPI0034A1576D
QFGHQQLSGAGKALEFIVKENIGVKVIYRNLPINILLTAFFFLDYYAIMSQNTDNTKGE